jgi:hypothetical protein
MKFSFFSCLAHPSTLKTEATRPSETSFKSTRLNCVQEDRTFKVFLFFTVTSAISECGTFARKGRFRIFFMCRALKEIGHNKEGNVFCLVRIF